MCSAVCHALLSLDCAMPSVLGGGADCKPSDLRCSAATVPRLRLVWFGCFVPKGRSPLWPKSLAQLLDGQYRGGQTLHAMRIIKLLWL